VTVTATATATESPAIQIATAIVRIETIAMNEGARVVESAMIVVTGVRTTAKAPEASQSRKIEVEEAKAAPTVIGTQRKKQR
jgi:hypothetical protein